MSENTTTFRSAAKSRLLRICAFLITLGVVHGGAAPVFSPWSAPVNLSPANSPESDLSPFVSADGLSLYFATTRPGGIGGEDLWVAHRSSTAADFGAPVNLGPTINTSGAERSPALSADGRTLYFATMRPGGAGGFDIWAAKRADPNDDLGWQAPVNLGPLVNSSGTDAGPNYFVNPVNNIHSLYFASNRPGGMGGLDLYTSDFAADGSLGAPSPVSELNSPGLNFTSALRNDGLEIIFASNRSGVTGLWTATRSNLNTPWSAPFSLGPNFQIGSEAFPALSADGQELYFYSARPGGLGSFDIYRSARTPVPEPGAVVLTGTGLLLVIVTVSRRRLRTDNRNHPTAQRG